jgi:hypothetical protein
MQKLIAVNFVMSFGLIAGCATSTGSEGIVEIGPDKYRVASLGRFADYSSSALKARLYQDAYRHCAAKNKLMVPSNGANQSSASGTQSSEMEFQCVTRNQASAPAPAL